MACVSLSSAKQRIERILESAEKGAPPSMELMSTCIKDIADAIVQTAYSCSSDPEFKKRYCQRGCGYIAEHHVCDLVECHL